MTAPTQTPFPGPIGQGGPLDPTRSKPPYKPTDLKPPLTRTQRRRAVAWLDTFANSDKESQDRAKAYFSALNDGKLIQAYTSEYILQRGLPGIQGPPGVPNPLSIVQFLTDLWTTLNDPHLWLRILEVLIGAILVGVGISHLSGAGAEAIKSIPLYGQAVNRAMHPAPRRAYKGSHSA